MTNTTEVIKDPDLAKCIKDQVNRMREVARQFFKSEPAFNPDNDWNEAIQCMHNTLMHLSREQGLDPFHIIVKAQSDYVDDIK